VKNSDACRWNNVSREIDSPDFSNKLHAKVFSRWDDRIYYQIESFEKDFHHQIDSAILFSKTTFSHNEQSFPHKGI